MALVVRGSIKPVLKETAQHRTLLRPVDAQKDGYAILLAVPIQPNGLIRMKRKREGTNECHRPLYLVVFFDILGGQSICFAADRIYHH